MSIFKKGQPEVIKTVVIGSEQFESVFESIAKENNLVRCKKCWKLISKFSGKGKTIKHRGIQAIVDGKIQVKCPNCGEVIKF